MRSEQRPLIGICAWRQSVKILEYPMTIFQIDQEYVRRVRSAGGIPILVPHLTDEEMDDALRRFDGLLFTGGDDVDPRSYGEADEGVGIAMDFEADEREIALVRKAVELDVPILGICRGSQIINIAFGGKMAQEITLEGRADHGPRPEKLADILGARHDIEILPDTRLYSIFREPTRSVNTTHHQANTDIADGLRVSARAPDGTIEALEPDQGGRFSNKYIIGVQWHPEKLKVPQDQELFDDFVSAASDRIAKSKQSGAE